MIRYIRQLGSKLRFREYGLVGLLCLYLLSISGLPLGSGSIAVLSGNMARNCCCDQVSKASQSCCCFEKSSCCSQRPAPKSEKRSRCEGPVLRMTCGDWSIPGYMVDTQPRLTATASQNFGTSDCNRVGIAPCPALYVPFLPIETPPPKLNRSIT